MSNTGRIQIMMAVALVCLLAAPLLNSSVPGAFGVRYLADRAVVTYTVAQPAGDADGFTLRVRLPERVQWGFLDREQLPQSALGWSQGQAVVTVPFGSGRLHLGWAGKASLPPESAEIPVFVGDSRIATLTARFDLEGMQVSGEATGVGPGLAVARVEFAEAPDPDAVSLSVGSDAVQKWRRDATALEARESIPVGASPRLSLRIDARGLTTSPVTRIVFAEVEPASVALRVPDDEAPEGVLIEAEDFSASTGTPPRVEPGSHHGTSGDACVFTFIGDGSSLTWEFAVPEAGAYDLYLRMACGDVGAWRVIEVDGEVPEGLELVELPGTGGWGHAEGEWWIVRITGGEGQPAPMQLAAGEHSLRMTGVLATHLNIDYLLVAEH